ncbi:electron transport complex subunit RsxC [Thalassotalea maritima]|uniref:electron transport complex subunit RsxC n=1 Tax=Thalassotalea maritima TaxID=3242416 RepID=UPI0035271CC3
MESVIERIKQNRFFKFPGGIHPPEQKFLSNDKPIRNLALPKQLILPLKQHIGKPGDLLVKVGDKVLKGQQLSKNGNPMAVPVHAPTSGTVTAIELATIAHPSAMRDLCLFIEPDGEERWRERHIVEDFHQFSKADLVDKIAEAGIAGMGGAGFPTNIKVNTKPGIKYLIINAAECEPYITADDLLMREQSAAIANGIDILDYLLEPEHILIGIEDNKPEAIATLRKSCAANPKVQVCVLPTKYPMGGEKQLIKALLNEEVPSGMLPVHLGIVMQNVATVFAISEAVLNDTPLIRRVVTVTGNSINKPQNYWVPLGTPVSHILQQAGFTPAQKQRVIMGGPLMGFTLPNLNVPIVKISNCILAPTEAEIAAPQKEIECVRCGQCADVCPSSLLPQELQWYAKAQDHEKLQELNLFDCIDCGACAFVCPSHIPLVHYYRVAKAQIRHSKLQEAKAERAKVRFEARKLRLEKEKNEREEKHRQAMEARRAAMTKEQSSASNSAVAAALARVKAKKAATTTNHASDSSTSSDSSPQADAKLRANEAIARAKARKAAQQANVSTDTSNDSVDATSTTDKQDAKQRAIAKAKERAAQRQVQSSTAPEQANASSGSDASVEATTNKANKADDARQRAIAKAKAKVAERKAAQQTDQGAEQHVQQDATPNDSREDAKQRAIAKAKAKAAERKAAQQTTSLEPDAATQPDASASQITDDKKAKVAAAVAKAKARKLAAQQKMSDSVASDDNVQAEANEASIKAADDKKAKIAAAVAKAKAKKLNKQQGDS